MKQIIILLFLVFGTTNFANPVQKDCTYKGKKLFGKVEQEYIERLQANDRMV